MSLLSIIVGACARLNLPIPQAVIGSQDAKVIQLQALLVDEMESLRDRHDWTTLQTTVLQSIPAAVSNISTVALPTDFQRFRRDGYIYHVSRRMRLIGPEGSADWQRLSVGFTATSTGFWRRVGSNIQVVGCATNDQITYDYIRSTMVVSGGSNIAAFAADTDTTAFPENVLRAGLIWRWRNAKGLEYAEAMAEHERLLEVATSEDQGGNGFVTMSAPPIDPVLINPIIGQLG